MAKLNAKKRKALPKNSFAGPHDSFPMEDKSHAEDAVRMAKFASPDTKARIRAKAKKFGINTPSLGSSKKKK